MMRELGLKPYRPQLLHALNEDYPDGCCEFASIFLNELAKDSSLLDRIVWTDEGIIKLNGRVSRHNCVYYATEKLHAIITQELNSPGIIVWAGIWIGDIIGPFFFHGDNVNASSYLEILQKEIVPAIQKEIGLEDIVYMHDGLKDAVIDQMQSSPRKFCQSAYQSVRERLQLCRDLNGEHIEQYL